MCRIAVLVNVPDHARSKIAHDLQFGGSLPFESWRDGNFSLILNRFPITSKSLPHGTFPLIDGQYAIMMDGEVYSLGSERYVDSFTDLSDLHFALRHIEEKGIDAFIKDADFEGTLVLYDQKTEALNIYVDAYNVRGFFYAYYDNSFIGTSEYSVVNNTLRQMGAPDDVPIFILHGGHALNVNFSEDTLKTDSGPTFLFEERKKVWSGSWIKEISKDKGFLAAYGEHIDHILITLRDAVQKRLPSSGRVAVLCSGGVDSSLLLKLTVDYLKSINQIDRLLVVTFGTLAFPNHDDGNDLFYVQQLCRDLKVEENLCVIEPRDIQATIQDLWKNGVFCERPRLVTPNPVRTHIRHTVMQSAVLGHLVTQYPDIRIIISGDIADELFAGYPSMHWNLPHGEDIVRSIGKKLTDLPLNDLSRVALASLYGCKYLAAKNIIKTEDAHPIEVRLPYSSRFLIRTLCNAPYELLTAEIDKKWTPKFLLRLVALKAGLPFEIAFRRKVPFNEGGTNIENASQDFTEMKFIASYLSVMERNDLATSHSSNLKKLNISHEIDHIGFYRAGLASGLQRLLLGNVFSNEMPDSLYSSHTSSQPVIIPVISIASNEVLRYFARKGS